MHLEAQVEVGRVRRPEAAREAGCGAAHEQAPGLEPGPWLAGLVAEPFQVQVRPGQEQAVGRLGSFVDEAQPAAGEAHSIGLQVQPWRLAHRPRQGQGLAPMLRFGGPGGRLVR